MADGQMAVGGSKFFGRARMAEITAAIGEEMAAGFNCGFGHARAWRVPPHWSVIEWHEELCALAIMSAWQASRDFDQARGVPLAAFVCCRIKARVLTRYRQEWRYAVRNTPAARLMDVITIIRTAYSARTRTVKIDLAMWLYFLDNFENNERNLVDVKRRWDPEDYFHHSQSIPLRPGTPGAGRAT